MEFTLPCSGERHSAAQTRAAMQQEQAEPAQHHAEQDDHEIGQAQRSEESRVGKECGVQATTETRKETGRITMDASGPTYQAAGVRRASQETGREQTPRQ